MTNPDQRYRFKQMSYKEVDQDKQSQPNWSIDSMGKKGTMDILDRSNWTYVVGVEKVTRDMLDSIKELARKLVMNNKVLLTTLSNILEIQMTDAYLKLNGKVILIEPLNDVHQEVGKIKEIKDDILLKGGAILEPFEIGVSIGVYGSKLQSLKYKRRIESSLIASKLSSTVVLVANGSAKLVGVERFPVAFANMLKKKTFRYRNDKFYQMSQTALCEINWEPEYVPLRKYLFNNKF